MPFPPSSYSYALPPPPLPVSPHYSLSQIHRLFYFDDYYYGMCTHKYVTTTCLVNLVFFVCI